MIVRIIHGIIELGLIACGAVLLVLPFVSAYERISKPRKPGDKP